MRYLGCVATVATYVLAGGCCYTPHYLAPGYACFPDGSYSNSCCEEAYASCAPTREKPVYERTIPETGSRQYDQRVAMDTAPMKLSDIKIHTIIGTSIWRISDALNVALGKRGYELHEPDIKVTRNKVQLVTEPREQFDLRVYYIVEAETVQDTKSIQLTIRSVGRSSRTGKLVEVPKSVATEFLAELQETLSSTP